MSYYFGEDAYYVVPRRGRSNGLGQPVLGPAFTAEPWWPGLLAAGLALFLIPGILRWGWKGPKSRPVQATTRPRLA